MKRLIHLGRWGWPALLLLAGCRPAAPVEAPVTAGQPPEAVVRWRADEVIARSGVLLTEHHRTSLLVMVDVDGQAHAFADDGTPAPAPTLPANTVLVAAGPLDASAGDELVAVSVADDAWRVTALSLDGTSLWQVELPAQAGAQPTALAVGDVTGDERADVAVAGSSPTPLALIDGAGTLAWRAEDLREVVAVLIEPGAAEPTGQVVAVDLSGQLWRYDAAGTPVAGLPLPLHATALGRTAGLLFALGRSPGRLASHSLAALQADGSEVWRQELVRRAESLPARLVLLDTDGDGVAEAVTVSPDGRLMVFGPEGLRQQAQAPLAPRATVLWAGAGPTGTLALGTSQGLLGVTLGP